MPEAQKTRPWCSGGEQQALQELSGVRRYKVSDLHAGILLGRRRAAVSLFLVIFQRTLISCRSVMNLSRFWYCFLVSELGSVCSAKLCCSACGKGGWRSCTCHLYVCLIPFYTGNLEIALGL